MYLSSRAKSVWWQFEDKPPWWVSLRLLIFYTHMNRKLRDAAAEMKAFSRKRPTLVSKSLIIFLQLIFLYGDASFWIWLTYWRGNLPVKMISVFFQYISTAVSPGNCYFIYLLFISRFIRFNRLWKWKAFHTIWQTPKQISFFPSAVHTLEMSCR